MCVCVCVCVECMGVYVCVFACAWCLYLSGSSSVLRVNYRESIAGPAGRGEGGGGGGCGYVCGGGGMLMCVWVGGLERRYVKQTFDHP